MIERFLPDEAATTRLGADLAMALKPGDVLALRGDLGAGKTTLARGLIRALVGDPDLDVPSPTFTLVQTYEARIPLSHFDLYRLSGPGELDELGLDEAAGNGAVLVEWPERAEGRLPATTILVDLEHDGEGRRVTLSGEGASIERIARSLAIRDFLATAGLAQAERRPFVGDASARSYETVHEGNAPERVLMNAPPLVLGPPVRDGKAYAEIAHTARNVAAFVAVDRALAQAGFSVPKILAADLEQGFLLTDHLGSGAFLDEAGVPIAERYAAAATLLAHLHRQDWQPVLPAAPGVEHHVPPFDREALLIEVDLLVDWYVPWQTGAPSPQALRDAYRRVWNAAIDRLDKAETSLVLRDFHSPNIVWRPERSGLDRLGLVDFQDALIGPAAYDVASLAMDARVTIPAELEETTVDAYVAARTGDAGFDEAAFRGSYAIMAAQRNSKILGIFVRLDQRDGKPAYLKHLPRIRNYLARALSHPALADLRRLYVEHGFIEDTP